MQLHQLIEAQASSESIVDSVRKAIEASMNVRGARLDSVYEIEDDTAAWQVEYDFPEHMVKGAEIKKAGKPNIAKVEVLKSDLWREGVYGVQYELKLAGNVDQAEGRKLEAEMKKKYKVKA